MYKEDYHFNVARYMEPERFKQLRDYAVGLPTPCLIVDLELIRKKYVELQACLPSASIYYAVKANPMPEVLRLLASLGSNFDVASRYELDLMLSLDVSPVRLSYGNTIKKCMDIAYFYEKGVRIFATDSETDLLNIAQQAPGAKVFFRILTEGTGADWPLSRKFGAHSDMLYNLVLQAQELNVIPWGVSFHVGSQQRDIGQWDDAIARCKYLFDAVAEEGIELKMINIGGGFPANYVDPTFDVTD